MVFQISLPVLASSAITLASSVVRKSLPSNSAAPRLTMPQQTTRVVSGGYSTIVFQISRPVSASTATVFSWSVTKTTPHLTRAWPSPPRLAEEALQGEIDATLTFWNFCADLESKGQRRAIAMDDVMKGLGAKGPV